MASSDFLLLRFVGLLLYMATCTVGVLESFAVRETETKETKHLLAASLPHPCTYVRTYVHALAYVSLCGSASFFEDVCLSVCLPFQQLNYHFIEPR